MDHRESALLPFAQQLHDISCHVTRPL